MNVPYTTVVTVTTSYLEQVRGMKEYIDSLPVRESQLEVRKSILEGKRLARVEEKRLKAISKKEEKKIMKKKEPKPRKKRARKDDLPYFVFNPLTYNKREG